MENKKPQRKINDIKLKNKQELAKSRLKRKKSLYEINSKIKIAKLKEQKLKENLKKEKTAERENLKKQSAKDKVSLDIFNNSVKENKKEILEEKEKIKAKARANRQKERNLKLEAKEIHRSKKNEIKLKRKEQNKIIKDKKNSIKIKKTNEKLILKQKMQKENEQLKEERSNINSVINEQIAAIREKKLEIRAIKKDKKFVSKEERNKKLLAAKEEKIKIRKEISETKAKDKQELLGLKLAQTNEKILTEKEYLKKKKELQDDKFKNNDILENLKTAHTADVEEYKNELETSLEDTDNNIHQNIKNIKKADDLKSTIIENGREHFSKRELKLFNKAESPGEDIVKYKRFSDISKIENFKKIEETEKVGMKSLIKYMQIISNGDVSPEKIDDMYKMQLLWIITGSRVQIGKYILVASKEHKFLNIKILEGLGEVSLYPNKFNKQFTDLINKKLKSESTIMLANGLAINLVEDQLNILQDTNITGV